MARTIMHPNAPFSALWVPYAPEDVTRALRGYYDAGSTNNPPQYENWTEQDGRYGTLLSQSCPAAIAAAVTTIEAANLPAVDDAAVGAMLAEKERRSKLTWDEQFAEDSARLKGRPQ